MLPKSKLREWPWNNMPSKRHVWKVVRQSDRTGFVEHCARCGAHFVERADTRGPVYCYATPQWLAEHPEDNGAQG